MRINLSQENLTKARDKNVQHTLRSDTVDSTNGVGETRYPHAKERSLTLHHIQKLTQNRSKT